MRRFINIKEASFNLKRREEILTKLADKIIWQSTQNDEYGLGKSNFLLQVVSNSQKWGHQQLCNHIIVDNNAIEKEYGFENKVPDLTITLNEHYIYITSDKEECRVGKIIKDSIEETDVSEVISIVKYIIKNGFTNLYANKDFAEMNSYSYEKNANEFYVENFLMRKIADEIFEHMLEYASEIGFGIEIYNTNHEYGIGLLDKKIILSSSQLWKCEHKMEDSFVGIEYDSYDLKISFINYHHRIKLSSRFE